MLWLPAHSATVPALHAFSQASGLFADAVDCAGALLDSEAVDLETLVFVADIFRSLGRHAKTVRPSDCRAA